MIGKINNLFRGWKNSRMPKIFCIGRNKTGTTSMAEFLGQCGYNVAPQTPAELLIDQWHASNFEPIIRFARTAGNAFQDIPFSLPETFVALHKAFPESKFILTVRGSSDDWYRSLTNYHAKLFGHGKIPDKNDLMEADYNGKGWMWKVNQMVYHTPENDIYNREILIAHYEKYNNDVIRYFSLFPGNLLVVNLADADAPERIAQFLNLKAPVPEMPWENKNVK